MFCSRASCGGGNGDVVVVALGEGAAPETTPLGIVAGMMGRNHQPCLQGVS